MDKVEDKKDIRKTYFKWKERISEFTIELSEANFEDKNNKLTHLRYELYSEFIQVIYQLKLRDVDKKKKYGELYKYYKFDDIRTWNTIKEIESQIYSHNDYVKICTEYAQLEMIVKHYEGMIRDLDNFKFAIKNTLDALKFRNGYM